MKKKFLSILLLSFSLSLQANTSSNKDADFDFSSYMLDSGFEFSNFGYKEISPNHFSFNSVSISSDSTNNDLKYDISFDTIIDNDTIAFEKGVIKNDLTNMESFFSFNLNKESFKKVKSLPELIKKSDFLYFELNSKPDIFSTFFYKINKQKTNNSLVLYLKDKNINENMILQKEKDILRIEKLKYDVENEFSIEISTSIDIKNPTILKDGYVKINFFENTDFLNILKINKEFIKNNQIKIQLKNTDFKDLVKKIYF